MTLQVEQLSMSYSGHQVLDNISLYVNEGEFVSILGPSGSGKSTLFHLIGGLVKPDSGEVKLNGSIINGKLGHVSFMPQDHSLLPWRTVLKNIVLSQELKHKPDEKLARDWLKRTGLENYENAYPHELSGGMKQRVSFLRSLLAPQSFMCMDEPFSALDEFTRLEMQQWLLSIWEEQRRSILLVTHNIDEALLMSDRIYLFSDKPAKIKEEIIVPFPRPRKKELLLSDEFTEYKRKIYLALEKK
ncbi:ABC transporter ATP-binding protein [Bacillus sp. AFS029533]|uniref:ABC transporter ATP-binding protein n=1 Tax=Bacillus sp. AFS029533 TaxID=2033494 RepID=UPI000BFC13CB|nr:ABC transporter ATP-binding protein [Bacillus sp. AFS029533]PGZ93786.1 ABC transporter ATP-binding protein [Bacillus sp. AFS029533]